MTEEGGGTEADFVEYYGYHYYCNPSTLPETFCICADLVVRDVLYVSPEASSYHNSKHCTVNQAIELLKSKLGGLCVCVNRRKGNGVFLCIFL